MMRDPTLNGETRSHRDRRLTPLHERQTRVAIGLGVTENVVTNGHDSPTKAINGHDEDEPNAIGLLRSKTTFEVDSTHEKSHGQQRTRGAHGVVPVTPQSSTPLRRGRPPPLQRLRSDGAARSRAGRRTALAGEEQLHMRHGWEDEYTSNEYLSLLSAVGTEIRSLPGL